MHIKPRQLWFLCSSILVLIRWGAGPPAVGLKRWSTGQCLLKAQPSMKSQSCHRMSALCSYVVSGTFPHTFMYLSGLLVSVAYVPIAFTLPCLFSLKLLVSPLHCLAACLVCSSRCCRSVTQDRRGAMWWPLQANQITALEYTLSTWVIPVSIVMSLMGCWACLYQMVLKASAQASPGPIHY